MTRCRIYRGEKKDLPSSAVNERLIVTTDTCEVFVGRGYGKPIEKLITVEAIAKFLSDGFVI